MVSLTSASGRIQKHKDTECTSGAMVTNMKENGKAAYDLEMGAISSQMEMYLSANMSMENQKALVSISG